CTPTRPARPSARRAAPRTFAANETLASWVWKVVTRRRTAHRETAGPRLPETRRGSPGITAGRSVAALAEEVGEWVVEGGCCRDQHGQFQQLRIARNPAG